MGLARQLPIHSQRGGVAIARCFRAIHLRRDIRNGFFVLQTFLRFNARFNLLPCALQRRH